MFLFSVLSSVTSLSLFSGIFLHNKSPWLNLVIKTLLLIVVAIAMNFFIYFTYSLLIEHEPVADAFNKFIENTFRRKWLLEKMPEWVLLFILTQLAMEINQKYSQGVFFNIIVGKYLHPRDENRIIMFIDLKNSTPIAEKLGHTEKPQMQNSRTAVGSRRTQARRKMQQCRIVISSNAAPAWPSREDGSPRSRKGM